MWLPFSCEKSGTTALVLPGVTAAGRLAGRQNSAKLRNYI